MTESSSSSNGGSGSSDSSPFPPGCTDGGPSRYARVVGADEIRISTIFTECEDPTEPGDSCSWDDYVAVLTIPGLAEGTYDLSEPGGASFVYTLYWDHEQSEAGCFCIDTPSGTDIEVSEGMISISPAESNEWAYAVTIEGLAGASGKSSFLVELAC